MRGCQKSGLFSSPRYHTADDSKGAPTGSTKFLGVFEIIGLRFGWL